MHRLLEELWSQIRSIWPDHGYQLRIDLGLLEDLRVPQWLKHRASQLTAEVDRTLQAIVKAQPEARVRQWLDLKDARDHGHHSRGSILVSVSRFCA